MNKELRKSVIFYSRSKRLKEYVHNQPSFLMIANRIEEAE
jgi:hypothetical protein